MSFSGTLGLVRKRETKRLSAAIGPLRLGAAVSSEAGQQAAQSKGKRGNEEDNGWLPFVEAAFGCVILRAPSTLTWGFLLVSLEQPPK